ncbi:MAG: hypothetical protein ACKOZT_09865 [Cyanobium sp.]
MIVLKISNASEVMAAKVGKFLESLTPDGFDLAAVEDVVLQKLVQNLSAEGIHGEVAAVRGLNLEGPDLVMHQQMDVRSHRTF